MADPTTSAALYCDGRGWACEPVLDLTGNETLANVVGWLGDKPLNIFVIIVVAFVVNRLLRRFIRGMGDRMIRDADRLGDFMPSKVRLQAEEGPDDTRSSPRSAALSTIARSVATTIVVIVASAAILNQLGVSLTALFASAGVIGVALGFGAQTLVRDVLAGWFILVEDRYGVGDTIDVGGAAAGVVERVTLRSTRLRALDGTVWHVANGEVLQVGNKSQNWSRAVVDVVVSPTADIDRACELLAEAGEELLADPAWSDRLTGSPEVQGVNLIDLTGVTLRVTAQTQPSSQWMVEREYRRRVLRTFEKHQIPLASLSAQSSAVQAAASGVVQLPK